MAQFAKKLYIKNSAGTQQTANIYSTTGEVGSTYMYAKVDGTTGYIALVATSHSKATKGRVIKSGTTYAIGSSNPPAYTYKTITSAGSGTFTVPSRVTKLRVTCVGGGAGGVINNIGDTITSTSCASAAGGKTTFGSVSANGATAPVRKIAEECSSPSRDSSPTCWKTAVGITTPSKGYANGYYTSGAHFDYHAGASATPMVDRNGTTRASVGAGGYADGIGASSGGLACGGSGYRTVSTITVTPGQSISYTVGAGGKCYDGASVKSSSWSSGGEGSGIGSAGGILIEYGIGVE